MTWSILARDSVTGALGVAVATKSLAVGGIVPHGAGRLGVLATQARFNPLYGVDGLRLLAEGRAAQEVLDILLAADPGSSARQVHLMDARGGVAAHTGERCEDWAGHLRGPDVSVAGNKLAGPDVARATLDSFLSSVGDPFAERLIAALEAGEAAGGDKRGRQSAAIKIWRSEPYAVLDLRTDDHADPLRELRRLHELAQQRYVIAMETVSSRTTPGGLFEFSEREKFIAERRVG